MLFLIIFVPLLDRQAHKDYNDIVFPFLLNRTAKPWESAGETSGLPIINYYYFNKTINYIYSILILYNLYKLMEIVWELN